MNKLCTFCVAALLIGASPAAMANPGLGAGANPDTGNHVPLDQTHQSNDAVFNAVLNAIDLETRTITFTTDPAEIYKWPSKDWEKVVSEDIDLSLFEVGARVLISMAPGPGPSLYITKIAPEPAT